MHHVKPQVESPTGKQRLGKGFSPDELKEAGINVADARRLRLPVDRKRRTSHEENVEALKAHAEKAPAKRKAKAAKKKA